MAYKQLNIRKIFSKVITSSVSKKNIAGYLKYKYANPIILILFITYLLVNFTGCCAYSFTGASVPKHLKTIAIPNAEDRSSSGEPGLSEMFTSKLTQKFIDDNTLQVTNKSSADAILECTITSLSDVPSVIAAGENVTSRRITITVRVVYKDLVKRKTIYDKSFSNYGDYPSGGSINDRKNAIETAIDRITDDILLDTVSGW
jgi:Lipopolysaccharide-assembly